MRLSSTLSRHALNTSSTGTPPRGLHHIPGVVLLNDFFQSKRCHFVEMKPVRARLHFVVNGIVACFYKAPVGNDVVGCPAARMDPASRPLPGRARGVPAAEITRCPFKQQRPPGADAAASAPALPSPALARGASGHGGWRLLVPPAPAAA